MEAGILFDFQSDSALLMCVQSLRIVEETSRIADSLGGKHAVLLLIAALQTARIPVARKRRIMSGTVDGNPGIRALHGAGDGQRRSVQALLSVGRAVCKGKCRPIIDSVR